jgi:hypothetical protein
VHQTTNPRLWSIRAVCVAAVLAVGVSALVGCSEDDKTPTTPTAAGSTSPATAPATPDPTNKAKAEILAAYKGMREAQIALYAQPAKADPKILNEYAFEDAAGAIRDTQLRFQVQGIVKRGRPVSRNTRVTALNLQANPPTAVLEDCLDTTNWKSVEAKTGKSVSTTESGPRPVTARARVYMGQWVIVEATADGSRKC